MKLNTLNLWKLFCLCFMAVAISACDDDDPEVENEEELITTVTVTFTNSQNSSDVRTATFQDIDGPGGDDPVITNPTLEAGVTYSVAVTFLNESETPAEDITEEIEEEDDEHQIFFTIGASLDMTYSYADEDGDGNPIGLAGQAMAGDASSGNLNVTLLHEPNKDADGVSEGDMTNAGGETDISVDFTVQIQQ